MTGEVPKRKAPQSLHRSVHGDEKSRDSRRPNNNSWSYITQIARRDSSPVFHFEMPFAQNHLFKKKKKRETGCGSPWICAIAPPCGAVERRAGGWPPGSPLKRTVGRISFPQRVCLDGAATAPSENAGGM